MGKPTGFLEYDREMPEYRPVDDRLKDYQEFTKDEEFSPKLKEQSARCMSCGTPFCHTSCPLGNIIPEFNDAVYREAWEEAWEILSSTNNFPEFTGRICPAPCEAGCVLGINQKPVTIENIEKNIAETAYKNGWAKPLPPLKRTDKKVAVVGSGPAGMAAAAQLNRAGHQVVVFERAEHIGGLMRYGIPDFKFEKSVVQRRVELMEAEGVEFRTNTEVGTDVSAEQLKSDFDAVVLAGGSTVPRDLPVKGREADGVHFAMDFLSQNNSRVAGKKVLKDHAGKECAQELHAKGKKVVVIGGGDTGSDCVGTSNRHGAESVLQLEIMPKPPEDRDETMPWPTYPMILKTTTSHQEGVVRQWCVTTKEFIKDDSGKLVAMRIADVEWVSPEGGGRPNLVEVEGSEREIEVDLVFLAMGFVHPEQEGILKQLGVGLDDRGNVAAEYGKYATSVDGVFAAGDMRRGQSLVVWAIHEGRECARNVDAWLRGGQSILEAKQESFYDC